MSDRRDNLGPLGAGDAGAEPQGPPPRDELDGLLREWHGVNAQRAAAGRDRLMAALGGEQASRDRGIVGSSEAAGEPRLVFVEAPEETRKGHAGAAKPRPRWRRVLASPFAPLAAAAAVGLVLLPFVVPGKQGFVSTVTADPPLPQHSIVMAPEAGRMEAFDSAGNLLGPCALVHTDVQAEITGRFSRVTVKQEYRNGSSGPIEAVYAFPLGEGAAVDRMEMTIGDRVVAAEVRERVAAAEAFSSARESARTASLLEQARPNVFTQSVANIPAGETVAVELSYVERITERAGEMSFTFPAAVTARYATAGSAEDGGRPGVVLCAPAEVVVAEKGAAGPARTPTELGRMLAKARAIDAPEEPGRTSDLRFADQSPRSSVDAAGVWYDFMVEYPDGAREPGVLMADGCGQVGGRWFASDSGSSAQKGAEAIAGQGKGTDATRSVAVPGDTTRSVVVPQTRAGQEISIAVMLDSGGPGIERLESAQHAIVQTPVEKNGRGEVRKYSIGLDKLNEIPNRDFVLKWKESGRRIGVRSFAHAGEKGNFFSVELDPPDRVADELAMPRELVFAVDRTLAGDARAMGVARRVIERGIAGMRAQDKFNVTWLGGEPEGLWSRSRVVSDENRGNALAFVDKRAVTGGVDVVAGLDASLGRRETGGDRGATMSLDELAKASADGRGVEIVVEDSRISSDGMQKGGELVNPVLEVREGETIRCTPFVMPEAYRKRAVTANGDTSVRLELLIKGTWISEKDGRVLRVSSAEMHADSAVRPVRVVVLLTAGLMGSEAEALEAIRRGRGTARVFPLVIGERFDRAAIERMASAGGGEAEFVYLAGATDAQIDGVVERFTRRLGTPVLTDVSVEFAGVRTVDVLPASDSVPDLWSERPLTILGRYTEAGTGTMTVRGQAATGRWEETIPLVLPEREERNSCLPTLWARGMADELLSRDVGWAERGAPEAETRAQVVRLGELYSVVTPFTSLVAVEKLRVVVDGAARLVRVPEEAPALAASEAGWERYFGTSATLAETGTRLTDKSVMRQSGSQGSEPLRLNGEGVERVLKLASMQDQSVFREVEKQAEKKKEQIPRGAPGAPVASPGRAAPADGPAMKAAPAVRDPAPAPAVGGATKASPLPASSTASQPAQPVNEPMGPKTDRLMSPGAPTGRPVAGVAPPASGTAAAEGGKRAQTEWVNRGGTPRNARFPEQRGGNEAPEQTSNDAIAAGGSPRGAVEGDRNDGAARAQEKMLGLNFDVRAVANDAPGAALAGCVSTLAAVELAEAGRDEEARQVACQSANVLQGAAASNLNVFNGMNAVTPNNNDWRTGYSIATNSQANAPVLNVKAAAAQLCGALDGKVPEQQRRAVIEQARSVATAGYLENRRLVTLARKLSPELLARVVGGELPTIGRTPSQDPKAATTATPKGRSGGGGGGAKDRLSPNDAGGTAGSYRVEAGLASDAAGDRATKVDATAEVLVSMLLADTSEKTLDALRAAGAKIEAVKAEAGVVVARVPVGKLEEVGMMEVVRRVEVVAE